MRQVFKYGAMSLAGFVAVLFVSAQSARAEMEVLESNVPELNVGAVLDNNVRLKVPNGASVRLLVIAPSGSSTRTLKGPYEGTVADYKEERSWWDRVMGTGDKDPETPMGTTRGLRPQK